MAGTSSLEQAGGSADVASIMAAFSDMVAAQQHHHDEEILLLYEALLSRPQPPRPSSKSSIPHPPMLNENVSFREFNSRREQWNDYTLIIHLTDVAVEEQLATLRNRLSIQMRSVLKNAVEMSGDTTVDEVITAVRFTIWWSFTSASRRKVRLFTHSFVHSRKSQ